ncbi:hypothetical protein HY312_00435 [Candidatus Saccharibacteria bacterium]|nr:hypothetical protein [Candidatus Saccharibacteria bacterium]
MITPHQKIYVQLQPSASAIQMLINTQAALTHQKTMRTVSSSKLHLTVLHIGLVQNLIDSISQHTGSTPDFIIGQIDIFITELSAIMQPYESKQFKLSTLESANFGTKNTILVIKFKPTTELEELYASCLQTTTKLLERCGITSPISFMEHDRNLKYALSIKPHVTIAKSYTGARIKPPDTEMEFSLMPLLY